MSFNFYEYLIAILIVIIYLLTQQMQKLYERKSF